MDIHRVCSIQHQKHVTTVLEKRWNSTVIAPILASVEWIHGVSVYFHRFATPNLWCTMHWRCFTLPIAVLLANLPNSLCFRRTVERYHLSPNLSTMPTNVWFYWAQHECDVESNVNRHDIYDWGPSIAPRRYNLENCRSADWLRSYRDWLVSACELVYHLASAMYHNRLKLQFIACCLTLIYNVSNLKVVPGPVQIERE